MGSRTKMSASSPRQQEGAELSSHTQYIAETLQEHDQAMLPVQAEGIATAIADSSEPIGERIAERVLDELGVKPNMANVVPQMVIQGVHLAAQRAAAEVIIQQHQHEGDSYGTSS